MSVDKSTTGDITVISVDGDLAGVNTQDFRALALQCLADGNRDFMIDLSTAPCCDSEGLEALTWLQRECAERLGLVKLCAVGDTFRTILSDLMVMA